MSSVWVSIGSNEERITNVRGAVSDLRREFGFVCVSQVYETEAVGFEGPAFYNLVARFETLENPEEVLARLLSIESAHGRDRTVPKFGSRTLDIDLLLYDDLTRKVAGKPLPHPDILSYVFVLGPLAELLPDGVHPVLQETYKQLWLDRPEAERAQLVPIPFRWIGDD